MNTHSSLQNRVRSLYVAFAALMVLLIATMGMSFVDLGAAHTSVGLGIAVVKTLVVAGVFMNLLVSNTTVRLVSAASLLWLSFFVLFVMGDYLTRGLAETQEKRLHSADQVASYDRVEYHDFPETSGVLGVPGQAGDQ